MTDGKLYAWGYNQYGQIATGNTTNQAEPHLVKLDDAPLNVKSVKIDGNTVFAINDSGHLYTWGHNRYGQVGNGESGGTEDEPAIVTSPHLVKVNDIPLIITSINSNTNTVYATTQYNNLYAWGYNDYGQVGNNSEQAQTTPFLVTDVGEVKSIAFSDYTVYVINSNNELYAWGRNDHGQVGDSSTINRKTPNKIDTIGEVDSVHIGYDAVYVIDKNNGLYAWGSNGRGQIGNSSTENQRTPHKVTQVGKVKSVTATQDGTVYVVTTDDTGNELYAWGKNDYGQVGNGNTGENVTTPYKVTQVGKVKSITISEYNGSVYAITTDNKLYAWGYNTFGQLGNGNKDHQSTPSLVKVGETDLIVNTLIVNNNTVYAINTDDKLYAWGENDYGQVGNSSTENQTTPYEVTQVGKVKSIDNGYATVYAITSDDRLFIWGDNYTGQAGNGSTDNVISPLEATEVGKVRLFTTDNDTVYVVNNDNKLYAWGSNWYGEVGNGESGGTEENPLMQTTPYPLTLQ